jgi:hypothetical protein
MSHIDILLILNWKIKIKLTRNIKLGLNVQCVSKNVTLKNEWNYHITWQILIVSNVMI